ncbi:uncharacterized protein IL334_000318 [Kwoniella shivajii]|uniref:Hyaluronan/mRNA-binding protein domain-containing protein n=1 Tax=Kwoniella shivajii TaxID=564305 RepID=A0ABZ1CNU7_9TREE|nr:hypothetical protein IL334_000318 [Kwoniella shivajii]
MTRTERNQNPAALLKDRHSRSGLTKSESSHKGGDGAHNWGSLRRKGDDEISGALDANDEERDEFSMPIGTKIVSPQPSSVDIEGTGNDDIARSPTNSTSSIDSNTNNNSNDNGNKPVMGRRMSNVSDEERKEAREFRGGWSKNGVDLAHIARTSYGIAQSPTETSYMSTSPTKVKSGFNFVSYHSDLT